MPEMACCGSSADGSSDFCTCQATTLCWSRIIDTGGSGTKWWAVLVLDCHIEHSTMDEKLRDAIAGRSSVPATREPYKQTASVHTLAQIQQKLVLLVELNQTVSRVFEVQDHEEG